jgi:hypothetical protein
MNRIIPGVISGSGAGVLVTVWEARVGGPWVIVGAAVEEDSVGVADDERTSITVGLETAGGFSSG